MSEFTETFQAVHILRMPGERLNAGQLLDLRKYPRIALTEQFTHPEGQQKVERICRRFLSGIIATEIVIVGEARLEAGKEFQVAKINPEGFGLKLEDSLDSGGADFIETLGVDYDPVDTLIIPYGYGGNLNQKISLDTVSLLHFMVEAVQGAELNTPLLLADFELIK